jgi:hypothetical protein
MADVPRTSLHAKWHILRIHTDGGQEGCLLCLEFGLVASHAGCKMSQEASILQVYYLLNLTLYQGSLPLRTSIAVS